MIFRKVKAKIKWFMKVKAKEKSIDLVKSLIKVQCKMRKWLSIWLALWSELWKLKKMLLGRSHSHSHSQFGQMWQLQTCINSIVWRLNTTNNSANTWLKCRQIVWGLRVHSLHLSSGKLYESDLFETCSIGAPFLQRQRHKPTSKDY